MSLTIQLALKSNTNERLFQVIAQQQWMNSNIKLTTKHDNYVSRRATAKI